MGDRRAEIGRLLLVWYEARGRDLPWRRLDDPYATWVSEIMLQQTTVGAVAPRFERFLEVFPDLPSLAEAREEDVLAELQGLGYYRRFRAMKKAAEQMLRERGGELPRDRKALEALPGIGEYTAGAILSIAFGLPEAAVDGNVVRVVTRLEAIPGSHETPARKRALGALVLEMMPEGRAADFNQALFDLGARVCLPRAPLCEDCPLAEPCLARAAGRQSDFPEAAPRRASLDRSVRVALLRREGKMLFERRADSESRMPGFLQLPEVWCDPGADGAVELERMLRDERGLDVEVGGELARCRHGITHHRLDCRLHEVKLLRDRSRCERHWLAAADLDLWPVTTISKKLLSALA